MRYVAIGDSFTEGMGDTQPDGSERGWADLVAAGLAAGLGEPIRYANLAIRGRLLQPIVTDQLDAALALDPKPTLLSLNGGGNDMMRPGSDMTTLVAMTENAIRRCLDNGIHVLLLSGADPSHHLPFGASMRRKAEALTAAVAPFAGRFENLTFVDMFHDREIQKPGYWSADRLHLNANGHRRVAGAVLTALGHPTPAHVIDPGQGARGGLLAEARYYREHVLPWIQRRLRGQSSGDDRTGKYTDWISVPAIQPA
ncbi:GDSL family lipase [Actinoplanes sp. SE50]|uniref:SGNH/GDSL hydrolase family protein n=1 Tax=unclassified Actinoplanes TaxID=2626549 RepID=UPI00023EC085|nr:MULTISPECIES: SGNH/GDSL hydrolase family protein [unclassified Actinoplanes]AEV82983.1 GDSL family lipase [Actinoplanes sp. SE50/110]ATO81379.1 GDSL family lipase [Actinoplanes sp. SE50]SLL98786.1 lipase [Actinoplanes sp. SE50/110]